MSCRLRATSGSVRYEIGSWQPDQKVFADEMFRFYRNGEVDGVQKAARTVQLLRNPQMCISQSAEDHMYHITFGKKTFGKFSPRIEAQGCRNAVLMAAGIMMSPHDIQQLGPLYVAC